MGMARLNIWVSETDDPCRVSNRTWYITIYNCDGNVLQWCGRKYVVMPARCGHLEVEVPPGCYYVKAVWGFTAVKPGLEYRVNHFTDAAIVQAGCDETACVKLFNPSIHRCGVIIVQAVRDLLQQKAIKPDTARMVTGAIEQLLAQVPKPVRGFEIEHLDEIEKLVAQLAAEEKEEPVS